MSSNKTDETVVENAEPEQDIAEDQVHEGDLEQDIADQASSESEDVDDSIEAQLEAALDAQATAKDDVLRIQAEMQNLRRRTEQDIEKAHKYGQEKFAAGLLPVMDNLERALAAAADNDDETVKAIADGVDLTLKSFVDCFAKFKLEVVDPEGEPFDPQSHQAISAVENPEVEPNTVIAVVQKGYTLHGRVIRPAMVMVSKSSSPQIDEKA